MTFKFLPVRTCCCCCLAARERWVHSIFVNTNYCCSRNFLTLHFSLLLLSRYCNVGWHFSLLNYFGTLNFVIFACWTDSNTNNNSVNNIRDLSFYEGTMFTINCQIFTTLFERTFRNPKFRGWNITTTKKGRQLFGGRKVHPQRKSQLVMRMRKGPLPYFGMGPFEWLILPC